VAIWGVGGVGMAALMAAVIAGASTIIAIDLQQDRLDLARDLGATASLNGKDKDVTQKVINLSGGGVDYAVDCTGSSVVIENMVSSLGSRGCGCSVGIPKPGTTITIDAFAHLSNGRKYIAAIEGDCVPDKVGIICQCGHRYADWSFSDAAIPHRATRGWSIAAGEDGQILQGDGLPDRL
jgi:Zn-dependent alcohol dehydrogenase